MMKWLKEIKYFIYIQNSGKFCSEWYLENNPDVAEARENSFWYKLERSGIPLISNFGKYMAHPLRHYIKHGCYEHRKPTANFNGDEYCLRYPDVDINRINPLYHYLRYGIDEGRMTSAPKESCLFNCQKREYFSVELARKCHHEMLGEICSDQMGEFSKKALEDIHGFSTLMYQYRGNVDELIIDFGDPRGGSYLYRVQQENKFLESAKKIVTVTYSNLCPVSWQVDFVLKSGHIEFPVQNVMEILNIIKFLSPKHIFVNNFAFCGDLKNLIGFFIGQSYSRFFEEPVPLQPLTPGTEIKMDFISEKNNLHTIELFMATYARKNKGYLQWELLDSDGHMIRSSEINVGQINGNRWCTICFSPITNSAGKKYQLIIKSFCKNSKNAVTCYAMLCKKHLTCRMKNCISMVICKILYYAEPLDITRRNIFAKNIILA